MRLIDADALKAVYERYINEPHVRVMTAAGQGMQIAIKSCIEILDNAPTIDAVPVVRCKDCEHLMFSDCYGECAKGHKGVVYPDDTCKFGVRRSPEGE